MKNLNGKNSQFQNQTAPTGEAQTRKRIKSITTVLGALNNNRIKLESITRNWFTYKLNIQELVWERNFEDGWEVDVYRNDLHIGTLVSNEATNGEFIIKEIF